MQKYFDDIHSDDANDDTEDIKRKEWKYALK